MKTLVFATALIMATATSAKAKEAVPLTYSPSCILNAVTKQMDIKVREDIPLPTVYVASKIPLKQFQDAVEPNWKIRPKMVVNVFVPDRNEIYLLDDASYYKKTNRFIDDSLAHELVHYIQVKYKGVSPDSDDFYLEDEAVLHQTRIREEYLAKGISPCAKE